MSDAPHPSSAAIDRDNPWPGLASFTEDARGFFFGREKETDELSRLVRRQTLTVLFGQSGLGKSSLLQAGVFPLLREADFLPLYLRLDHDPASPPLADQVKAALVEAFKTAGADAPAPRADESLWEYFHRKDIDIWSAKNRLLTPVLAFDQFEEVFTLGRASESARERSRVFLAELACLVENRAPVAVQEKLDHGELDPGRFNFTKPSCQVILSLREDFLPDLEGLKHEMPALVHNRLRLKKLSGTQALEIVTKPAPHLLAEGVAERIVEFVAGARGGSAERLAELDVEPPLLSVICRELNERRRALGQDKITADLVSGNRREILHDFYERSVRDLPEAMREFIEDHLLTKSGFRDNLALETALEHPGVTRPLLDALVSRRLVRLEDRLGIQRVELTHDVLADVIRAARDTRQQRLASVLAVRRTRRLRWAVAGLGLAVVGLCIGAFFGIRAQRSSAAQASQTDYVLGSRLLDEGKLSEGLAYLVRSGRKDPGNSLVAPRLLSVLTSRNFMLPVGAPLALPSPSIGSTFFSDGRWLGYQGEDDVVRLIDAVEWRVEREYAFPAKVRRGGVAVAKDNPSKFAVLLVDNTLLVCDRATGQPLFPAIQPPERVAGTRSGRSIALSSDGQWLAATGRKEVWIWDATSGQLRATVPNEGSYSKQFTFSPDGRTIVTTTSQRATQFYSVPEGRPIGPAIESASNVIHTDFSADGRRLLVFVFEGVSIIDVATRLPVRPVLPLNPITIWDIWLTSDGRRLIYTSTDRTANVLEVDSGKPVFPPLLHGGNVLQSGIIADGKILFTNSLDGLFRLWDLETGKLLAEPTAKQPQFSPVAVAPDGQTVALFSVAGPAYKLRLGRGAAAPLAIPRTADNMLVLNMAVGSPARVVWLDHDALKVLDIASGRETKDGYPLPARILRQIRSSWGSTLGPGEVILAETASNGSRIWTLGEGDVANDVPLADAAGSPTNFVLSATKRLIVSAVRSTGQGQSGNPSTLSIWDTRSGKRVAAIQSERPIFSNNTGYAFTPDEKRVAYRNEGEGVVHICEISTGREISNLQLTGRASINTFFFNSDGTQLISGDSWGGVQVWDYVAGRILQSAQGHRASVNRFDFSNDGRSYASVSGDGTVQVWDAVSHQPVGALLEQSGTAGRAHFSPDNVRVATPSSSGAARVWDVRTGLPVTEVMNTGGTQVSVVAFSAAGDFIDVHGGAYQARQHVRFFAVPPPGSARIPDWLLTLATLCAGSTLTDEGKLLNATPEFGKIADVQRTLAAAPASDPYAEWGRWVLSEDPNRSIAPRFTITPAEAAKLAQFPGEAGPTGKK